MYLVEIKLGDAKIRRYVLDSKALGRLIQENIGVYEYVKILEEYKNDEKPNDVKVRNKRNGSYN